MCLIYANTEYRHDLLFVTRTVFDGTVVEELTARSGLVSHSFQASLAFFLEITTVKSYHSVMLHLATMTL